MRVLWSSLFSVVLSDCRNSHSVKSYSHLSRKNVTTVTNGIALWGFVRDIVYQNGSFNDISTMSNAIIDAFAEIRRHGMHSVKNACLSFWDRVDDCINREGKQLIHR